MRTVALLAIVCVVTACGSRRDGNLPSSIESEQAAAKTANSSGGSVPPPEAGPPELAPSRPDDAGSRGAPSQPPAKVIKLTEPNRNGVCRFEERDPSLRPKDLVQTNFHSNMIFWADRGAALWDHPYGLTDEGMAIPGKRIVVAREGQSDLWISPGREGDIMLFSGPDRFECVLRGSN